MAPKKKVGGKTLAEEKISDELANSIAQVDPLDICTIENYREKVSKAFEELYEDCNFRIARSCSRKERQENEYNDQSLTYGEVLWEPFAEAFLKLKSSFQFREVGGKFVDIGSGTGKPVFGAALLHKFDDCVGIEILEGLHGLAEKRLAKWHSMVAEQESLQRKKFIRVSLVHGDATVIGWADADVVFINSTCFEESLMNKLAALASDLKPGSFVLTTTRVLPSNNFEVLESNLFKECWGTATIFIQRRKNLS